MTLSTLILLAAAGDALAHRPHDDAPAFAASPDYEVSGLAWSLLDPHDITQLMRTDDWGQHWDFVCGPTMEDIQTDAGYQGDALIFMSEEGRVWVSEDDAETWTATWLNEVNPYRTEKFALSDDYGLIATERGVLAGDLTGDLTGLAANFGGIQVTDVSISADDPDRALVGLSVSEIYLSTDKGQTFELHSRLPGGLVAISLLEVDGTVYAGTDGLGVLRWEPGLRVWEECGVLPFTNVGDYVLDIPLLEASSSGHILATNGHEALFFSQNACDDWLVSQTGEELDYGGIGNAQDPEQAFVSGGWRGRYAWVAGYNGVTISTDNAETWFEAALIPPDYVRGVAFAPDFPKDPRVFIGGYGGGAWWTSDGGQTFEGSAVNVLDAVTYDIQPSYHLSSNDLIYYSGSVIPYVSHDGGRTYEELADIIPISRVRAFRSFETRTYALGEEQELDVITGQLAYTEDDGDTWTEWDGLYEVLGASAPNDVQEVVIGGQDSLLVVADSPPQVILSQDDGATWDPIYAGPNFNVRASGAVAWPPGDATRLLFADPTSGVVVSDDGGETWAPSETWPGGTPRQLTVADDGTIFLVLRVGQIYRSEDGGDTWIAGGEPVRAAPHDLMPSPDFAKHNLLLLGTHDGMFFSPDRGDSWQRLRRFGRMEANSNTEHLLCWKAETATAAVGAPPPHTGSTICDSYDDDTHGLKGGYLMAPGDELHFSITGTSFRLLLPDAGDLGELRYELNGELVDAIPVGGGEPLEMALEGPDGEWKDITFVWTPADVKAPNLHVDALEFWGGGDILPMFIEPEDTADTGVDTGEDTDPGDGGDDTGTTSTDDGGDDTDADDTDSGSDDGGDGGAGEGCCNRDASDSGLMVLPLLLLVGWRRRE